MAGVLAMKHGRLFPVLNYTEADPKCPIRAVTDRDTSPGDSLVNVNVTPQGQASAAVVQAI